MRTKRRNMNWRAVLMRKPQQYFILCPPFMSGDPWNWQRPLRLPTDIMFLLLWMRRPSFSGGKSLEVYKGRGRFSYFQRRQDSLRSSGQRADRRAEGTDRRLPAVWRAGPWNMPFLQDIEGKHGRIICGSEKLSGGGS